MYKKIYNENCSFDSVSACLSNIVEKSDFDILENFFDIIRQYEVDNIEENKLIEETIFFLNNLELFGIKNTTKFAILSLNTRVTIIESLKLANVLDKFNFFIGREDLRKWKPDPEGIYKIQDHFGIKKEEMIYFGDLKKDLLTGNNAGIEAYFIDDLIRLVNKKKIK